MEETAEVTLYTIGYEGRDIGGFVEDLRHHKVEVLVDVREMPVSRKPGNTYGYELMERVARFGFEAMNPGTLYRTLRQMEKNGLCQSKWETSKGGPARRVYSITDAGETYLDLWARSLEQYQSNMDTFFRLYTQGASHYG